jgi:hypothetical protein
MFPHIVVVIGFEIPVVRLMEVNENGHDFADTQAAVPPPSNGSC